MTDHPLRNRVFQIITFGAIPGLLIGFALSKFLNVRTLDEPNLTPKMLQSPQASMLKDSIPLLQVEKYNLQFNPSGKGTFILKLHDGSEWEVPVPGERVAAVQSAIKAGCLYEYTEFSIKQFKPRQ